MTENTDRQIESKLIESKCGLYAVCLSKESSHYLWLFTRASRDCLFYSLRLALPTEIRAAQNQLEMLKFIQGIPPHEWDAKNVNPPLEPR